MDSIKSNLLGIQKKIQNLKSDSHNSGILQELLNESGQLIQLLDTEEGAKIFKFRDELTFYLKGGDDNLEKFFKCKAEVLTIISQKIN